MTMVWLEDETVRNNVAASERAERRLHHSMRSKGMLFARSENPFRSIYPLIHYDDEETARRGFDSGSGVATRIRLLAPQAVSLIRRDGAFHKEWTLKPRSALEIRQIVMDARGIGPVHLSSADREWTATLGLNQVGPGISEVSAEEMTVDDTAPARIDFMTTEEERGVRYPPGLPIFLRVDESARRLLVIGAREGEPIGDVGGFTAIVETGSAVGHDITREEATMLDGWRGEIEHSVRGMDHDGTWRRYALVLAPSCFAAAIDRLTKILPPAQ